LTQIPINSAIIHCSSQTVASLSQNNLSVFLLGFKLIFL